MKKFQFTLQTPLNVKLTIEKQLMGELAECMARLRDFSARQEEYRALEAAHREQYGQILREGVTPAELGLWRITFLTDKERIAHQANIIEQAEGEVSRVQKKLTETLRERKTLEALKEKQYEEYKAALRAEDAAIMDDYMSSHIGFDRNASG